jgi:hypothetical protein
MAAARRASRAPDHATKQKKWSLWGSLFGAHEQEEEGNPKTKRARTTTAQETVTRTARALVTPDQTHTMHAGTTTTASGTVAQLSAEFVIATPWVGAAAYKVWHTPGGESHVYPTLARRPICTVAADKHTQVQVLIRDDVELARKRLDFSMPALEPRFTPLPVHSTPAPARSAEPSPVYRTEPYPCRLVDSWGWVRRRNAVLREPVALAPAPVHNGKGEISDVTERTVALPRHE